jgi:ATP-dependent DNA helicase RecG
MYALFMTVSNDFQGALMAPTEILARQHFISLSEAFLPLGINVGLLASGMPRRRLIRPPGNATCILSER